ncbi:MAG: GNAT family N-acetyltransferase [Defluviitaleaceae bacterium]|nr:GNAT family N-acetyltransferase [Defluviitaleaceae bacterium]MCL2262675.1 GNAT family N-acetyltransferase [Defluviitaleaceae bacterium]
MKIFHTEITENERDEIYKDFVSINEKYNLVQDNAQERISAHTKQDDKIIGYASGLKHGKWFTITDLWTRKEHRRKGIATTLLQSLLDNAAITGCTHAHVRTQGKKNELFYEKFGFSEMGRLLEFGGKSGFDSVFYQMPFPAKNRTIIREMTEAEYPLLEDFIYTAIYIPSGEELPPREVIFDPEIYIYVDGFGSKTGDHGVVAEQNGKLVGAAWTRIIPAYGHLDESTPELAISVLSEFRGQNIGTLMMTKLFELLSAMGYTRTSLSVQKNNPAVSFYQRLGYVVTAEKLDHAGHEDFIMVKDIGNENFS